jgi:hypothetical protein
MGLEETLHIVWGPQDIAIDEDANAYAIATVPTGHTWEVVSATIAAEAAVAAVDTNYNTFSLQNNATTGAAIVSFANGPAATGSDFAQAPTSMGTPVAAQKELAAGSVLYFEATKTGNGLAVPGITMHITIRVID